MGERGKGSSGGSLEEDEEKAQEREDGFGRCWWDGSHVPRLGTSLYVFVGVWNEMKHGLWFDEFPL